MHLGVILPNYGKDASPAAIRRTAGLAEELGFDSVWTTEHIIVGPEGVDPYGRVYDPLVTLGWIAGWTERIGLGTSIVLVPLHNPMHLAKEVATLQELKVRRPRDRPVDAKGGAAAARALGMKRLAERLEEMATA